MCKLRLILVWIAITILITACAKDVTDHPDYGKISELTTDWTVRGEEVDIPTDYIVNIGEYSTTLSGTVNPIENLFAPGRYDLYAYNAANGVSVNGSIATADYDVEGGIGWFFTGAEEITIDRDRKHSYVVGMRQQVRQLTLELEITGDAAERLTGVDGTLSGVARTMNIVDGIPAGSMAASAFGFTRKEGKYTAAIRLLGVSGSTQILSLTLHFLDNNPASYTVTSYLSDLLSEFNTDKITPITLSSILVVTPTQMGINTTVSDWMLAKTHTGVAD